MTHSFNASIAPYQPFGFPASDVYATHSAAPLHPQASLSRYIINHHIDIFALA